MITAWMLYLLAVGALLAVAARALDTAARRAGRATRWIWAGAMATLVLLAVIAPRPAATNILLPRAREVASAEALQASPSPSLWTTLATLRRAAGTLVTDAIASADVRVLRGISTQLGALWLFATIALFVAIAWVLLGMSRARRAWPRAELHGGPVRIAPEIGPAVIGLLRPEVVIPRWLLGRDSDEQRIAVRHEREHIAAGDQALLVGGWIMVALLPWHPAAWWMLTRLRLAIELDCDARVINGGIEPQSYGTLLIDIAGRSAGPRAGALALVDGPTHLERRLLAMKPVKSRFTVARVATSTLIAAVAVLAACEAKVPTSAEVNSMDARSAEKTALGMQQVTQEQLAHAQYTINDRPATAAEAHAITGSRITKIRFDHPADGKPAHIYLTVSDSASGAFSSLREVHQRLAGALHGDGSSHMKVMSSDAAAMHAQQPVGMVRKQTFDGVVMIDGVVRDNDALKSLSLDRIASVDVLKGAAAVQESSDPRAANGLIKVITKK